jgi:hypothetical protein
MSLFPTLFLVAIIIVSLLVTYVDAGFWPEWSERHFWRRAGPSCALETEEEYVERCREWLMNHCNEVVMPHLNSIENKGRPSREPEGEVMSS